MDDTDEMGRKRKSNQDYQLLPSSIDQRHKDDPLTLSLSPPSTRLKFTLPSPPPPSPLPPQPPPPPPPPKQLQNLFSPSPQPLTPPSYALYVSSLNIVAPSTSTLVTIPSTTTTVASSSTSRTIVSGPPTSTPLTAHPEPGPSRNFRTRRNPTQAPRGGKSEIIPAPFPWATDRRATVHSLEHLLKIGIHKISGEVQCKRCERKHEIEFDLHSKFIEVANFISANKSQMHDRAPKEWMNPLLPTCNYCEQVNSVKPIIAMKKKKINWLFLLLGQMLGCCTLDQLKYFCKHTKNHRTGAKDRVLYLTYLGLCKQLYHSGTFNR